jgi:hypothetical protein
MKRWLKDKLGITEMEKAAEAAALRREQEEERIAALQEQKAEAEQAAESATKEEELARKSPKDRATAKGEPWINVLDVKINEDNVRNGFFELDWNNYFVEELVKTGYGTEADPEEEIVDRWFRDIVYQMLSEEGLDTDRGSGYINVTPIDKGRSEIS